MENIQEKTSTSVDETENIRPIGSTDVRTRTRKRINISEEDVLAACEYFSQLPEVPKKIENIKTKKELLKRLKEAIMLLIEKNYSTQEISKMLTGKFGINIFSNDIIPIIKNYTETINNEQPKKRTRRKRAEIDLVTGGCTEIQSEPHLTTEPQQQEQEAAQYNDDSNAFENSKKEIAPSVKNKSGTFMIEDDIEI
jgi:predicted RNase H-like HicB family nuclease